MATIVSDVTGLQQGYHQQSIPHLVEKIKGFPLKAKSFRNTENVKNFGEGFSQPPPSPQPLYHGWGMNLRVRPRVKWRLGHSNLGYITSYKFIPLKASCRKSIAFFCRMRDFIPPVALIELLASAPVFIKYSYKNYFQHATLLKPSQHLLSHVMVIWILFVLNLSMPL